MMFFAIAVPVCWGIVAILLTLRLHVISKEIQMLDTRVIALQVAASSLVTLVSALPPHTGVDAENGAVIDAVAAQLATVGASITALNPPVAP